MEASIYGVSNTEKEQNRLKCLDNLKETQIYLLKSINMDDNYTVLEAKNIIVKLDKIRSKIDKL